MALRNIVKVGDPILNKKSRVVEKFDEKLAVLIDDMLETLYKENGVGLAAVQVVNPEITLSEGEQKEQEGCLSLPGKWGTTVRPMKVQVKAQDRNGNWQVFTGDGLKARAFCHELDHLDGILFTSRVINGVVEG